MTVDLSNLKLVEEQVPEVLDESSYVDAQEYPPPPPEGAYTLQQGAPKFGVGNKGLLKADMNHKIVGGPEDGKQIMFDGVSETPFERSGVMGMSTMRDQLRAVYPSGSPERNARGRQDMATALAAAEGQTFQVKIGWEGGCGHKGTEHEGKDWTRVKSAKNFPGGGDVPCSVCGQAIRPRARVTLRVPAN